MPAAGCLLALAGVGPAVVPGDKEASLILAALRHEGFDMPPAGNLPDEVIADFERRDGGV